MVLSSRAQSAGEIFFISKDTLCAEKFWWSACATEAFAAASAAVICFIGVTGP